MKKKYQHIIWFVLFFILLNWVGGKILLVGIERFYGLKQHSGILLVGHSHLMLAVDKDLLEQGTCTKVSKYTIEGVDVYNRYFMVKQYLDSPYSDSLKVILYGVDLYSFAKGGLSENSYTLFYPYMDEPEMDAFIKENARTRRDYLTHKLFPLTRYSDISINASFRGLRNDFSNYKTGTINIDAYRGRVNTGDEKKYNRSIEMNVELLRVFEKTIDMITQRGIKVVLVNTPIVDVLMKRSNEDPSRVIDYYRDCAASHALVEYWDFNPEYSSDYTIFYDPIHLNPQGQQLITGELVNRLNHINFQ
jgi:hypothetical protein